MLMMSDGAAAKVRSTLRYYTTHLFQEMMCLLTLLSVNSNAVVVYSKRWFLIPSSRTRFSHTCDGNSPA